MNVKLKAIPPKKFFYFIAGLFYVLVSAINGSFLLESKLFIITGFCLYCLYQLENTPVRYLTLIMFISFNVVGPVVVALYPETDQPTPLGLHHINSDLLLIYYDVLFCYTSFFVLTSESILKRPASVDSSVTCSTNKPETFSEITVTVSGLIYVLLSIGTVSFMTAGDYQEMHVIGRNRNIILLILEQWLFYILITNYFNSSKRSKLYIILFFASSFLTGMRMPALINIAALLIWSGNKLVARTGWTMAALLFVFVGGIVVQRYRVGEFMSVFDAGFWNLAVTSIVEISTILRFTCDILAIVLNVEAMGINFGEISLFSDFYSTAQHILNRIVGNPTMTMEGRAAFGSFGYNLIFFLAPKDFVDHGVTMGGASIAEAYYLAGFTGVSMLGICHALICNWFQRLLSNQNRTFFSFILFVSFFPVFLRGYRDGILSFVVSGFIRFAPLILFYLLISKGTNSWHTRKPR